MPTSATMIAAVVVDAGDGHEAGDGRRGRPERRRDLGLDRGDTRLQLSMRHRCWPEEHPLMGLEPSPAAPPPPRYVSPASADGAALRPARLRLAGHQRLDDRPAARARAPGSAQASFTFALSSSFWMRCACAVISRTSCLRVLSSRNACCGAGGTKLGRTSPCASKSASHCASFTSLLPARNVAHRGRMRQQPSEIESPALAPPTRASNTPRSFRVPHACSPSSRSQSASVTRARVVTCRRYGPRSRTAPPSATRTQATTVFLCTSSPAQPGWITSHLLTLLLSGPA